MLLRFRALRVGVLLSILATLVSTSVLLIVVGTVTMVAYAPADALYIPALSTTIRFVIPAPGGLGMGDVSIAGLLVLSGIRITDAATVLVILRSTTVIVRTSLGLITLAACYSNTLRRLTRYLFHQ